MLLGTIIQGRRYSFGEYGAASLLVLGIVLFTMVGMQSHVLKFRVQGKG
jgi:hypothetical protein